MNFQYKSENPLPQINNSYNNLLSELVPIVDTSVDRNYYKFQSNCHLCNLKLRQSKSTARDKLHQCKFCWQATCDSCSSLKLFNSFLLKDCRICNGCFKSSIKIKFLARIKEKFKERRRSSILAFKKDEERIKIDQVVLHQLIEETDAKNFKLDGVKKEISALYREINQNSRIMQLDDGLKRVLCLREELEVQIHESNRLSEQLFINKSYLIEMKNRSSGLEAEIQELETFLTRPRIKTNLLKNPEFRDVLLDQIACLKGLVISYKQDNRLDQIENPQKRNCNII